MIKKVTKLPNGMVMVFDEKGKLMPEFQGRYEEVRAKILAHAPKSAKFFSVALNTLSCCLLPLPLSISENAVLRKEW